MMPHLSCIIREREYQALLENPMENFENLQHLKRNYLPAGNAGEVWFNMNQLNS